ncbi:hypothetical protein pb186bvf_007265 [Paramecium bursaria]
MLLIKKGQIDRWRYLIRKISKSYCKAKKQELMAEAAEKRFQQQSKRGMNDQTAIDYEMKAQRLQAADDMRTKNGNEPYREDFVFINFFIFIIFLHLQNN